MCVKHVVSNQTFTPSGAAHAGVFTYMYVLLSSRDISHTHLYQHQEHLQRKRRRLRQEILTTHQQTRQARSRPQLLPCPQHLTHRPQTAFHRRNLSSVNERKRQHTPQSYPTMPCICETQTKSSTPIIETKPIIETQPSTPIFETKPSTPIIVKYVTLSFVFFPFFHTPSPSSLSVFSPLSSLFTLPFQIRRVRCAILALGQL